MLLSAALFIIGVIGVMVRRNIIIIFMSIELILNAVNINLVAFSKAAAERGRPGVRRLRDCGRGGRSGRRPRDHPGVLPEQGNRQHRRNELDAMVARDRAGRPTRLPDRHEYIWLIPLLPGIGAAINGLVGIRSFSRADRRARRLRDDDRRARAVARRVLAAARLRRPSARSTSPSPSGFRRFRCSCTTASIGTFSVPWGFRLDPLSGMMLLVVTGIGTLIHVYSTAYMADEPRGGSRGSSAT